MLCFKITFFSVHGFSAGHFYTVGNQLSVPVAATGVCLGPGLGPAGRAVGRGGAEGRRAHRGRAAVPQVAAVYSVFWKRNPRFERPRFVLCRPLPLSVATPAALPVCPAPVALFIPRTSAPRCGLTDSLLVWPRPRGAEALAPLVAIAAALLPPFSGPRNPGVPVPSSVC